MKIRILSDFHAEFYTENFNKVVKIIETKVLPPHAADAETILVLAGDICTAKRKQMLSVLLTHFCGRFKHVVYVCGNHEFYGSEMLETSLEMVDLANTFRNLSFGAGRHNIDGKAFNFCTLWTDFDKENPVTMYIASRGMNDYRQIRYDDKLLTPELVMAAHAVQKENLFGSMEERDIVVTHHAPSFKSIHPNYIGDDLNGCYASSLEELILAKKPALWFHGHVHHHHDYLIGDTRIVCNPVGYVGEGATGYKNDLVIEI